jgi:hypothetical protein
MADIVRFPPSPEQPDTPEHEALRQSWHGVEHAARSIVAILDGVPSLASLTDDARFRLQWDAEYIRGVIRTDAAKAGHLPPAEYHRRRDRLMRSLGLAHLL